MNVRIATLQCSVFALVLTAAATAAYAQPVAPATAQAYPTKSIRLVVPFPPGGASDVVARVLANEISLALSQPVVVENKPGAGGNIGSASVAKAAPDGYKVLLGSSSIAVNPSLYKSMGYRPEQDLAPISLVAQLQNVLVVHPSVAAHSVNELIALAKENPGKVNYASFGNGTTAHLAAEIFKSLAGVDIQHISYKGSADAMNALVAGQVSILFDSLPTALAQMRAGRVRALGVTGTKRSPNAAEIPTIAETGLKDYQLLVWLALFAPAGTPREVINTLNRQTIAALAKTEVKERLSALAFEIQASTPDELGALLRSETAKFAEVVRASGATIQ